MQMTPETKRSLTVGFWAALGGALLLALVGFKMGGWYTSGQAKQLAQETADTQVQLALVPVCTAAFMRQPNAEAALVSLKATDSNDRGGVVAKLVKIPGQDSLSYQLKENCAEKLAALKATAQK